jgi:hypothetical protein
MRFLLEAGVRPKDALLPCSYFTVLRASWSSLTLPSVPLDSSKILCVGQLITQAAAVIIRSMLGGDVGGLCAKFPTRNILGRSMKRWLQSRH